MNPWWIVAIALAALIVLLWALAELDRWWYGRRRDAGLRQLYDEAQREVSLKRMHDRRDRRPW